MKVNEVAKLVGISVRTLHHYDEIGLLRPSKNPYTGYRTYSDSDLTMLQQILFFKELGFSLKKIKEIINSPEYDQLEALKMHRKMLVDKREKFDLMLQTVDQTIEAKEGGFEMSNQDKFKGFDFSENPYEDEARERWGDAKVDEAKENAMGINDAEQKRMNDIYRKLAELRQGDPKSDEAQTAIKEWYDFLNKNFTTYTPEMFQGLGMMYVQDERFQKNIDQFGEGLAQFMSEAMVEFGERNK
ncbi:MerR family transcriptional regulator [Alkalibacillus haloalkaliphilus]|uniref:MerR family transcriptional regulator n=1 Tax=Alkalibacillus haloalkaliphilus TaxID=94136 RepID=A0A511W042_9BACI|nr:MerR family transcriptional regulator [Alkalibacillus haloalkaliphilus]GEN44449.1 MerR family transcriptional regulator [Alkalibacillus haloalkaliphilus]